jgi:putative membrane protein
MAIAADVAVGVVALIHIYVLVLEMFLRDKPAGLKAFSLTGPVLLVASRA